MKVGLFGAGAYGMALSQILIDNNMDVTMWTKFDAERKRLEKERANEKLLPGFKLDEKIKITSSIEEVTKEKDLLIIAIPAAFVNSICLELKDYISSNQHICIASKGIEQKTGLFIHNVVLNNIETENIAVISGPSFAKDVISRNPIGLTLATKNNETRTVVEKSLSNNYVKLRYTSDIIGTEICGSIKNVIALSAGMLEGLGANDSTRAMLITEALHDIEQIIEKFDGDKRTILSFAGFGDLLLTCTSSKSRNFSFGKLIGEGLCKEEINKYLEETTVEGYYTLESIHQLLNDISVNIPIIDLIYDIINNGKNPKELLAFLVTKV